MDDDDTLHDLGQRIRGRRLRLGRPQQGIAAAAGVSASVLSRMELGQGGRVALDDWLAVATVLGLPALGWPDEPPFGSSIFRLATAGGWRAGGFRNGTLLLDREARPRPMLRHVQLPSERAVVRSVATLIDPEHERRLLARMVATVRAETPDDRQVCGVLAIARHGANTRIAGPLRARSDGAWIRALRDPMAPMPSRLGLVWLAPRGTHLMPGW